MGVSVKCPICDNRFWAQTRAEWQELKCRKCHNVFRLEPHERRFSRHMDSSTGETVVRYRETPIPNPIWGWLVWGIKAAVSGFFLFFLLGLLVVHMGAIGFYIFVIVLVYAIYKRFEHCW